MRASSRVRVRALFDDVFFVASHVSHFRVCSAAQTCTVEAVELQTALEEQPIIVPLVTSGLDTPCVQTEDGIHLDFPDTCALECALGYGGTASIKCTLGSTGKEGVHEIEHNCKPQTCTLLKSDIEDKLHFDFENSACSGHKNDGDNEIVLNATNGVTSCNFQCAEGYYREGDGDQIPFTCENWPDRSLSTGESNINPSNAAAHQCKGVSFVFQRCLSRWG